MGAKFSPEYAEQLRKAGPCFTALDGDEVLACSGVVRVWPGRDMAWALISAHAGKRFVKIYRAIKRFLELHPTRRVEATVDVDFEEGHRLMKMLGFEYEGLVRAYMPDGRDMCLYARVKS